MSSVPDPKTWATGGDPATDKQKNFLSTLASEKGVDLDVNEVDKGTASSKIEELKNAPSSGGGGSSTTEKTDGPITTSDDPATDPQKRYLAVLDPKNEHDDLTKSEASEKINSLK